MMTRPMFAAFASLMLLVILVLPGSSGSAHGAAAKTRNLLETVAASPIASPAAGGASVTVKLFHDNDSPVKGACYAAVLQRGPGQIELLSAAACDEDDGANDGVTLITGLPDGEPVAIYVADLPKGVIRMPISQTFIAGEQQSVLLETGTGCVFDRPDLKCADIAIAEAAGMAPDQAVCYAIFLTENEAPGQFFTLACDMPTAEAPRRGSVSFHGIRPGGYQVVHIDQTGKAIGTPVPLAIVEDEDVTLQWEAH